MKITRENYEAFFLDYHEGNLSAKQKEALEAFLVVNPDLKKELDGFELITIEKDSSTEFDAKHILKKTSDHTLSNYDSELIAALEDDLNETDKATFLQSLQNNQNKKKDFETYKKTKIHADEQIIFPGKSSLKKFIISPAWNNNLSNFAVAAATVALLMGMYFLFPKFDNSPEIATHETVENSEIKEDKSNENILPKETEKINEEKTEPIKKDSVLLNNTPEKNVQPQPRKQTTVSTNTIPVSIRISSLEPKRIQSLTNKNYPEYIEPKTEFYWLSFANNNDPFNDPEENMQSIMPNTGTQSSGILTNNVLANAAFNTLEQKTGLNVEKLEQNIRENKLSFWDIAGAGISGISNITGTSLTINKENDENGRLTLLAIGERFKIQR
ncbi:MAG: hypothetical protein ACOC2E_05650 [Bacteroidota bacterium]